MWGTSTGGAGNNNFAAMATTAYQAQMAIANPGLWYFKTPVNRIGTTVSMCKPGRSQTL